MYLRVHWRMTDQEAEELTQAYFSETFHKEWLARYEPEKARSAANSPARSLVAAMPEPSREHYWWQIILPGSVVGLLVGYATQRWGGEGAV